jgi:Tfp pilus assembly protein PilN
VQLTGRTMDIQGLTRFMRQLEDSPFLANVEVISSTTVVDAGRAVTQFVLQATFSPPGRAHLRTTTVAAGREG